MNNEGRAESSADSNHTASTARPFRTLLCANRGEIAIRVFRAATELGLRTVAIYSHEDRVHLHRYKADEAYALDRAKSPVAAYLDVDRIIDIALEANVDAIHPGYGFLSERADFARRCRDAGIAFIGPSVDVLESLGDKIRARGVAQRVGVSVVPGTDGAVDSFGEVKAFADQHGYPLLIKAAHGGGGRGMRVVRKDSELEPSFDGARSEAAAAFGDGTLFVERYVEKPRHIEVQIVGDSHGTVRHLGERDCSVQRRHQKLIEVAPALELDDGVRGRMYDDAIKLASAVGYENAGTVEFLVEDAADRHYFIEVNPRIQVEHTVTEEVTGIDLVQSQIRIAQGATLDELGLDPEKTGPRGYAIQCRITTEDPTRDFAPDHGQIEVFRSASGMGIRLDGGSGYSGAKVSPHYDPLLMKVTAAGRDLSQTIAKARRALGEFRIRGVKTNIPFLVNVLDHAQFSRGTIDTTFVDSTPELFVFPPRRNRAQKLLRYLGDLVVNGPSVPGARAVAVPKVEANAPEAVLDASPSGWRNVLREHGPEEFARRVRAHEPVLVTDTTWRDAHQSLLATRVRTRDLVRVAPATAERFANLFSLEMWGGATFDVCLRFLRECPWDRLDQLRRAVPNIPFQMLLRSSNAVGYTSYPDNVVADFIAEAFRRGIDVFRVFDSLNDLENLEFACRTVRDVGGVVEGSVCYTGDLSNPLKRKYDLDYFLGVAEKLVGIGIHTLAIKDMAGLLKPKSATELIQALRREFPDLPIHVHTHDTAGMGVATVIAASEAGADVVDLALPALAGLTSQPSMGAAIAALTESQRGVDLTLQSVNELDAYWEECREHYAPFESGLKSGGADVYEHEMPGGQYTNLKFQAQSLGLGEQWTAIKKAYTAANRLLGDVIKVTPTSKVVGDLAQFMVQNELSEDAVVDQAGELSFPTSVLDFLRGSLGQPHGGFPEPLRTRALRGQSPIKGRPGASLEPFDYDVIRREYGEREVALTHADELSAALYPDVFREFVDHRERFGDLSVLSTRGFVEPIEIGEEISVEIQRGKTLIIVLATVGELDREGRRTVYFELNGQPRAIRVADRTAAQGQSAARPVADPHDPDQIGAPIRGVVASLEVGVGDRVERGHPLLALSAMKMETVVSAPRNGTVVSLSISKGDEVSAGDLLLTLEPEQEP